MRISRTRAYYKTVYSLLVGAIVIFLVGFLYQANDMNHRRKMIFRMPFDSEEIVYGYEIKSKSWGDTFDHWKNRMMGTWYVEPDDTYYVYFGITIRNNLRVHLMDNGGMGPPEQDIVIRTTPDHSKIWITNRLKILATYDRQTDTFIYDGMKMASNLPLEQQANNISGFWPYPKWATIDGGILVKQYNHP